MLNINRLPFDRRKLCQPIIDLLDVTDRWHLVRGSTHTFEVATYFPGRSGWALKAGVPSEFTISDTGVITAVLPLSHSATPGNLIVETTQGEIHVPLLFRDWFPDNFGLDVAIFVSSHKSVDSTARPLWRGEYFSPLATPAFETQDIVVSSKNHGYINTDELLEELLAIGQPGILQLREIYEQADPNLDNLVADSGKELHILNVVDNEFSNAHFANGHPTFRGRWDPNTFDADWVSSPRTRCYFRQNSSNYLAHYGLYQIQKKRNGTGNRYYAVGDDNQWPGIQSTGDHQWRFHAWGSTHSMTLPSTFAENWLMFLAYSEWAPHHHSKSSSRRELKAFGLTASQNMATNSPIWNNFHSWGGLKIDFDEYDFAEMCVYHITNYVDSDYWRSNMRINPNAMVTNFMGLTHSY